MWALDPTLAQKRVFPAVDLELSYTLFVNEIAPWMAEHSGADWLELRGRVLELLQRERELEDIAALIGRDALQDRERFVLEAASLFREVVLQQNAFDPVDASSSLPKTHALASLAFGLYRHGVHAIEAGEPLEALPFQAAKAALVRLRGAPEGDWPKTAEAARAAVARMGGDMGVSVPAGAAGEAER
jgi:V/A-type H+-transporting ATPase subunit A